MQSEIKIILDFIAKTGQLKQFTADVDAVGLNAKTSFEKAGNVSDSVINGKMIPSLKNLGAAMGIGFGVAQIVNFTREALNAGHQMEETTASFNNLVSSSGKDPSAIIQKMNAGFGGTVSQMKIMQLENNALIQGLDLTTQNSETLANMAERLGDAAGQDAAQGFETLTYSIVTLNERGLRPFFGRSVDFEEAFKKIAEASGRTVESLSLQEKQTIALNLVLEEGQKRMIALGADTDTMSDAAERAAANWDNLKTQMSTFVATVADPVVRGIGAMTGALNNFMSKEPEFEGFISQMEQSARDMGSAPIGEFDPSVVGDFSVLENVVGDFTEIIEESKEATKSVEEFLSKLKGMQTLTKSEQYSEISKALDEQLKKIKEQGVSAEHLAQVESEITRAKTDQYNKIFGVQEMMMKVATMGMIHLENVKSTTKEYQHQHDVLNSLADDELANMNPRNAAHEVTARRKLGAFSPEVQNIQQERMMETGFSSPFASATNAERADRMQQVQSFAGKAFTGTFTPQTAQQTAQGALGQFGIGLDSDRSGSKAGAAGTVSAGGGGKNDMTSGINSLKGSVEKETGKELELLNKIKQIVDQQVKNEEGILKVLEEIPPKLEDHEKRISNLETAVSYLQAAV